MKKFSWVAAVFLVVVLGIYFLQKNGHVGATNPESTNAEVVPGNPVVISAVSNAPGLAVAPVASSHASGANANAVPAPVVHAGAVQPIAADADAAPHDPSAIQESMRRTIRSYNTQFGENPVGNNAEITAALMGKNPRHLNFIQPDSGLQVNGNGELVDAWGTPFFFHQISGQDMEIHSAGPDKVMWTSDDLVSH